MGILNDLPDYMSILDMILWALVKIIGVSIVVLKGHSIINAFKGVDGKFQVEEIAKLVILVMVVFAFYRDATREHEWRFFDGTDFVILLIALFSMAGLDKVVDMVNIWRGGKSNQRSKPVKR